ncbi:tripartite tricarboxylate transporter substrate binding protein [Bordetella petrii]|nr:tripartite tricarboxylate transporter substrate binding protein [Bordetella petrii]
MYKKILQRALLSALLSTACIAGAAAAASYPARPIRLIAPIAVGGLTDTLARLVAAGLADKLGQPVVVENKPGAGGIIGMEAAAKSAPDGYTLILVYQGVAAVNASLYPDLPYDTLRDFTPVAGLGSFPLVLVTNAKTGIRSVGDLIQRAKDKPNALSYASAGNATTSHLTMELFKNEADIQAMHVPYKGEGPANTDVAGGQVDIAFSSLASVAPLIKSNRLVALGIGTPRRSPVLPAVPTIAEAGVPGFEAVGWYGLLAPAGTPAGIVKQLSQAVADVLNQPAVREKLDGLGVTANATSSAAFGDQIRSETDKWKKVIQQSHITVN